MTWLQLAADAAPHLVKPGCAKVIHLSLGRQEVNAVIFCSCNDGGDELCDNIADSNEENSNDDDDSDSDDEWW